MLLILVCLGISASGEMAAFLQENGSGLVVMDSAGETLFSVEALPGERLSYVAAGSFRVFCVSSSRGLLDIDMLTGETTVVASERTGAPWVDSSGDLWYTLNGVLYSNGEPVCSGVDAFHVSVENGFAAYTDANDNIVVKNIHDGSTRTVSEEYRFYAPLMLPSGDVLSPTLSHGILYLTAEGGTDLIAEGGQPCWSPDHQGVFYCVSSDDGHNLTGADLFFVRPGEEPVALTFTPDVYETHPSVSGVNLWYIDASSGTPGYLRCDDLLP